MDQCNDDDLASASFDAMNEPLTPTQIINVVMPSILVMSKNILKASTETTTREHDDLINCKQVSNNVSNSNAGFDSNIDDSSDLMGSTEKNHTTPDRIEDKAICLTPGYLSVTFNVFFQSSCLL